MFSLTKKDKPNNPVDNLDKKLVASLSKSRIPNWRQLKYLNRFLNKQELALLYVAIALLVAGLCYFGYQLYTAHAVASPAGNDTYTEGVVGSPKYINPLYASLNDVDNDLAGLVFSSLFRFDGQGKLVKDLATDYQVSADNRVYTIKINKNATFTNGDPLNSDDIISTFSYITSPDYKSALADTFAGVSIDKVDDYTVKFTLPENYGQFLQLLTFGILPSSIFDQISADNLPLAEINLKPVGSGMYKFASLTKNAAGNLKSYTLQRNDDYYGRKPYIKTLTFEFFPSAQEMVLAMNNGSLDGAGYLPKELYSSVAAKNSFYFHQLSYPQVNTVLFNLSDKLVGLKPIRQALALATDKKLLLKQLNLTGAQIQDGPVPIDSDLYSDNFNHYATDVVAAAKLLDDNNWKIVNLDQGQIDQAKADAKTAKGSQLQQDQAKIDLGVGAWRADGDQWLVIKLTAIKGDTGADIARQLADQWQTLGVKTALNLIDANDAPTTIVKNKNFSVVVYNLDSGVDGDLFPFWSSGQANNLTGFGSKDTDKLLAGARGAATTAARKTAYQTFSQTLMNDLPAIFLYDPGYTYLQSKKVHGFNVSRLYDPKDRFNNVADWYIKTKNKFKF